MKRTYIAPAYEVLTTTPVTMMAMSVVIDSSKSGGEALVKESDDWDIWSEGEE